MKVIINGEWTEVMNILKTSKNKVLKEFCFSIENFEYNEKCGNWKTNIKFVNRDGRRIDKENNPVACIDRLTFSKGNDGENRVYFSHTSTDNARYVTDKALHIKTVGEKCFGRLLKYDNGKVKAYSFQINKAKVTKFKTEGKEL